MNKTSNLTKNLKKLSEIADWFDQQEQVDVEEGLAKVKEAAVLIKESRQRFTEIANEFNEVKKDMDTYEETSSVFESNDGEEDTEEELF